MRKENLTTEHYTFTVFFEPGEASGFVATCPALPGLVTEGRTLDETREMVRDAIALYLESLREDGVPIPEDKELSPVPFNEKVEVGIVAP